MPSLSRPQLRKVQRKNNKLQRRATAKSWHRIMPEDAVRVYTDVLFFFVFVLFLYLVVNVIAYFSFLSRGRGGGIYTASKILVLSRIDLRLAAQVVGGPPDRFADTRTTGKRAGY